MIPTFNPLPDDKLLDWFKLKQTASDILKSVHNEKSVPYRVENIVGKRRNCLLHAISPFLTIISLAIYRKCIKMQHCVVMG